MKSLFGKVTPDGVQRGLLGRFGPIVGGLLSILLSPLQLLGKAIPLALHLLGTWWGKREIKHLLIGLPTIAVGIAVVGFILHGKYAGGAQQRGLMYKKAADLAFASSDWERSRLFYQRAVEMGINDSNTKFQLAKAAEKSGDLPVKVAVMESLAPIERPVFAPAHLWQATRVLTVQPVTRERVDLALGHLRHVLALSPRDIAANGMLGDIYFQAGRYDAAIQHLKVAHQAKPVWCLMLAKASALVGDVASAKTYGERSQALFRQLVIDDPEDVEARLDWGESTLLLEDFQESSRILLDGLKLNDEPRFKQALTQVLIHWADTIPKGTEAGRHQAFQLLARALEQAPREILLFDRIIELLKSGGQTAEEIEDFLLDNITNGRAVGISHLILGTALLEESKNADAGFHLERALEMLPQGSIVANNFAWYLIHIEPKEPDRALRIINQVIEQFPGQPELHDTRGHIQLELANWKNAINDLEISLGADRRRISTHEGLAKAYSSLGNENLAARHLEIVKGIQGEELNK